MQVGRTLEIYGSHNSVCVCVSVFLLVVSTAMAEKCNVSIKRQSFELYFLK